MLASNIAHVDTPGYRPIDMAREVEPGFGEALSVQLRRTDGAHLNSGSSASSSGKIFQDLSAGGGADGNYVSLDREASKLAANQVRYDFVSVLVSSELRGLAYAATDGKG